jgi:hypothetical protein
MFGIRSGPRVLRHDRFAGIDIWHMSENENHEPVVRESNMEIDEILQQVSVDFSDYSLIVYELDDDEMAEITIRKLQGLY